MRHEQEHDRQLAKRLKGDTDPAHKMEPMAAPGEDALRDLVDREFRCAESRFTEANFYEKAVHDALERGDCKTSATVNLLQPDGSFHAQTFADVADLGEGATPPPAESSSGCD